MIKDQFTLQCKFWLFNVSILIHFRPTFPFYSLGNIRNQFLFVFLLDEPVQWLSFDHWLLCLLQLMSSFCYPNKYLPSSDDFSLQISQLSLEQIFTITNTARTTIYQTMSSGFNNLFFMEVWACTTLLLSVNNWRHCSNFCYFMNQNIFMNLPELSR